MEMKPVAIILTHGHYDHIGAVNALEKDTELRFMCLKLKELIWRIEK